MSIVIRIGANKEEAHRKYLHLQPSGHIHDRFLTAGDPRTVHVLRVSATVNAEAPLITPFAFRVNDRRMFVVPLAVLLGGVLIDGDLHLADGDDLYVGPEGEHRAAFDGTVVCIEFEDVAQPRRKS